MPTQLVAVGAGVHDREAADPDAVLADVAGGGGQPEVLDAQETGEASLVDPGGFVGAPVLVGPVQAGAELSISGLESVSSTSTVGTNSLRTSVTAARTESVMPIGGGVQSHSAAQP